YARKKAKKEERSEVQIEEIEEQIKEQKQEEPLISETIKPEQETAAIFELATEETEQPIETEEKLETEERPEKEEIKTIQQLAQEETAENQVHKKAPQLEKNRKRSERK